MTTWHLVVARLRQALSAERKWEQPDDVRRKLEIIRAAARHSHPVVDIDCMLAEIEASQAYAPSY